MDLMLAFMGFNFRNHSRWFGNLHRLWTLFLHPLMAFLNDV